ncbi:MAG: nucleotidyltransferase family protein [Acidobacteriaceae bacterium]
MRAEIEKKLDALMPLCERHRVKRLSLFGSALRADFDPLASDFDFLVEFENVPLGDYARNYFSLSDSLAQLFARRIDLVEDGAIENPYIRRELEHRETLYAA